MTGSKTLGLVLAGGAALRMGGGDKPLRRLGDQTILQRILDRFAGQVDGVILSLNGDAERFAAFGLTTVPDTLEEAAGPLAGILAGLDWAAACRPDVALVASVAGDAPFLPRDLVIRLERERAAIGATIACAESGGRMHPVNALWPVSLRHDLRRAMQDDGMRKVGLYCQQRGVVRVAWSIDPVDPFFNVNEPADLAEAERSIAELSGA
ncbi:molybdenum cofactor guanylyltransferase MobA [Lichenihabitans psoromatis]|uniref:molybdenum cofactor guanylyltransferase MobA n=1 Tax=Lichenihabitans psoromatis TaxID=2528642 RepID=UPI0010364467|nr:molybdenum cofactor guanylyltransferase MobA [Lichenihabitans psoromatis]